MPPKSAEHRTDDEHRTSCRGETAAASPEEVGSLRAYELMVLIDPEVDERTVEPTLKKYLEVVTNAGGTVDNIDVWGRRKTAYEIQKKSEAIYVVVNFQSEPAATQELDRLLNLNETILRTKIIRPEEQKITAE